MPSRSLGHRAPLLWIVVPWIAGMAVARGLATTATLVPLAGAGCALLAACGCLANHPRAWAGTLTAAMFLAGLAAYPIFRARIPAWDELPPRELECSLQVDRTFSLADPRRTSGLATLATAPPHLAELRGQRVYFSLTRAAGDEPPLPGTIVAALGVLAPLAGNPPDGTFDGYLTAAGCNFKLTRGRVLAVVREPSAYRRFCAAVARRSRTILGLGLEHKRPELAGLLRAMMLGETHELSTEQRTLFMQSGTMHLFAISGLNIGVIAQALQALLLLARVPPVVRFVAGSALLWFFVDVTGATPSAVRAFVMAVFVQAAFVLRRPANLLAAFTASAFVVLLLDPLQVFSASFLMSYAIVFTLLVLGLPLGEAWLARWPPWRDLPEVTWNRAQRLVAAAWRSLLPTLAVGVSTLLVGLLTGLQFFQLLTPGALASNLLLIPAACLVTLGGFASLLCGAGHFHGGAVLANHAAALVLRGIELWVRWSVEVPGAFVVARFRWPWVGPAALALLGATLLAGYEAGWRPARGGWWPPFAVVALALAVGVHFGP